MIWLKISKLALDLYIPSRFIQNDSRKIYFIYIFNFVYRFYPCLFNNTKYSLLLCATIHNSCVCLCMNGKICLD